MIRFPIPFKYAAMDSDGEWHIFKVKPTLGYTSWRETEYGAYLLLESEYPEWEPSSWKESLMEYDDCQESDTSERILDAFRKGLETGRKEKTNVVS